MLLCKKSFNYYISKSFVKRDDIKEKKISTKKKKDGEMEWMDNNTNKR